MNSTSPWLVIITGPPAAGKSTLAMRLASDLRVPLLTKDGFKETLFDSLGSGEVAWSRQLGRAAFDLIFHAVEVLLSSGCDCLIEANFDKDHSLPSFERLAEAVPYRSLQLVCRTDPQTLAARYAARLQSGTRHPGHHTALLRDPGDLLRRHGPLAIPGPVIIVDNDSDVSQNYDALLTAIRQAQEG